MRWRGWSLLVLCVVLTQPAQADWPQFQRNAQRTAIADEAGPRWDDVAFTVQVPGVRVGHVILLGRAAYVVTSNWTEHLHSPRWASPSEHAAYNRSIPALWRIDLDTAQVTKVADLRGRISTVASDGRDLFVAGNDGVLVYDTTGKFLWEWRPWKSPGFPPFYIQHSYTECRTLAFEGGRMYPTCMEAGRWIPDQLYGHYNASQVYSSALDAFVGVLAAVDLDTHKEVWMCTVGGADPLCPHGDARTVQEWGWHLGGNVLGASMHANRVIALYGSYSGTDSALTPLGLMAVDRDTGKIIWKKSAFRNEDLANALVNCKGINWPTVPVGTAGRVFTKLYEDVVALQPSTGQALWNYSVNRLDPSRHQDTVGQPIYHEGELYLPTSSAIHRLDPRSEELRWSYTFDPATGSEISTPFTSFANGILYLPTIHVPWDVYSVANVPCPQNNFHLGGDNRPDILAANLTALDAQTGDVLWRHSFLNRFGHRLGTLGQVGMISTALARDALVVSTSDGTITVLGETGVSPHSEPTVAGGMNPAPGASIEVDLSNSRPSPLGYLVAYRAIWGDGTSTEWQPLPLFRHAYARSGTYEARFQVRSAADQSASSVLVFHVGADDPNAVQPILAMEATGPPPGPWLAALAAIGAWSTSAAGLGTGLVLLVLVVFLLAVWLARRGSLLDREVAAAKSEVAANKKDLVAAHAVLSARRMRAAMLLQKRRLTPKEHTTLLATLMALESTLGPMPTPPPSQLVPGTILFGRYRLQRSIGAGNYGDAWLARDTLVGRSVVLKILRERMTRAALQEARTVAAIRHPNVVTLFDVLQMGEQPVFVMEYAEGGSLRDRILRDPLSIGDFRTVARGLLEALHAVHQAGAVHRDVKPSNVLLTSSGEVKLADFGIARRAGRRAVIRGLDVTTAVGTLRYMSPEQAAGERVTLRSDLYSAAATLFEAWTGTPLFAARPGETETELQRRIASHSTFDREIGPPSLRAWFAKSLARNPKDRFAAAQDMLRGFERANTGSGVARRGQPMVSGPRPDYVPTAVMPK